MKNVLFLLLFISLPLIACSQGLAPGQFSERAFDTITRTAFARMVAGTEDIASTANYVSFVPTDGKFSLASNYFFDTRNRKNIKANQRDLTTKREREHWAVGVNASGAIVGGNVASLFEGGGLNTGVNIGVRISWQANRPNTGISAVGNLALNEQISALEFERDQKIDSAVQSLTKTAWRIEQLDLSEREAARRWDTLQNWTGIVMTQRTGCTTDSCKLKLTDSLLVLSRQMQDLKQKAATYARDRSRLEVIKQLQDVPLKNPTDAQLILKSHYGLNLNITYEDTIKGTIRKEYEDKIFAVEMTRNVQGMNLTWLSVIADWSRLSYRTYNSELPFTSAIEKNAFDGYSFGLQANHYRINRVFRKASLFNIAVLYKYQNNLEDLTASKLSDEKTISSGNVNRKSVTEYNVYTDTVKSYHALQVPVNYYRFFGKNLSFGWHAFALADFREHDQQIYDLGAGFIFGLNTAGSKRLLNVELFAKYKDISRELVDEETTVWKQMQFGLSVAIPFMIFKN